MMVHSASFKLVGDENHSSSILPAERYKISRVQGPTKSDKNLRKPNKTHFFNTIKQKSKKSEFFHAPCSDSNKTSVEYVRI